MFTMNVTKLVYHSPRPFWASNEVKAFSCENEFGNPSGHSMFAAAMSLIVWFNFQQNLTTVNRWSSLLLTIIFALAIGYSRLFLGVHSLD
jgi:membrane-associated phospholipid phosphatase